VRPDTVDVNGSDLVIVRKGLLSRVSEVVIEGKSGKQPLSFSSGTRERVDVGTASVSDSTSGAELVMSMSPSVPFCDADGPSLAFFVPYTK
jgi:hypothetical protein